MKLFRTAAIVAALLALAAPVKAQWQTPNHSVPIGQGGGNIGFNSAVPGTAGLPLVSNGASADPLFQALPSAGIATGAVGNAQLATAPANTIKCNPTGSVAAEQDCLVAQILAPSMGGNNVFLINNSTSTGMNLQGFNGNTMWGYCTTTSSWKLHTLQLAVNITAATNSGGNVQLAYSGARQFIAGEPIWIAGVGGTTEANGNQQVSSTTFNSGTNTGTITIPVPFVHAYTSGGSVAAGVIGLSNLININGTPNQSFVAGTTYSIGFQFLDSACTIGQLVASTTGYSFDPNYFWPTLNGFTNTPLVGAAYLPANAFNGIQGGANSEYVASWYNQHRSQWQAPIYPTTGNTNCVATCSTNGVTGSFVRLTVPPSASGYGSQLGLIQFFPFGFTGTISCTFDLTSTAVAAVSYGIGINSTSAPTMVFNGYAPVANQFFTTSVVTGTQGVAPAFITVDAFIQTSAGTLTSGQTNNSNGASVCVYDGTF